jgi:hypothetical protein
MSDIAFNLYRRAQKFLALPIDESIDPNDYGEGEMTEAERLIAELAVALSEGAEAFDLREEAKAALAPFAHTGWMTPDTTFTARTVIAHMHPERERELHLSSDDFLRAAAVHNRLAKDTRP